MQHHMLRDDKIVKTLAMDRGFGGLGTMRCPIANAPVGRNRFIAPIGRASPIP
jgi:hypothetical protein